MVHQVGKQGEMQMWMPIIVFAMLWSVQDALYAQQVPNLVLYNGKIITMDNHEINANLGTIAQAIAIREGRIVAVGNNDEILRLAGGNTRSIDLRGRLVTPGFGATHDHPPDWDPLNPYIVRKVVTDDIHIERFLWEGSPDAKLQQFPRVLNEAVQKAKPGQWIRISLLFGRDYRGGAVTGFLGRQINKEMLDMAAPNNPVVVRAGFVGMQMNQMAIEEVRKYYGDQWGEFLYPPLGDQGGALTNFDERGYCVTCYRYVEQDALYRPDILQEIYRLGLSWMAGYGQTLNGTSLYTGGAIRAYNTLDRLGQLAIRFSWGYYWPFRNDFFSDPYFVQAQVSREGTGSDYFWNTGMTSMMGTGCSVLPGTSSEVKEQEPECRFSNPVTSAADALYEYIKAGGRLTGDHMTGDKDVDILLDVIEKASKDAGMTPDEIRSKRHITEHMAMYPRPDQIPRFKRLGLMTSGWDFFIYQGSGQEILRDYGERGAMAVVPRKSLYEAGIMNSVEIDRPIGYTDLTFFHVLYSGITRKDWDGNVTAPQQAISREAMLKSATLWAGYGTLRENDLGSLEPGKWADLIVIDRDYLTVPVEEIPKLRVLMTIVGGKMEHLVPSLAREWGVPPTGAQVELGGPAVRW